MLGLSFFKGGGYIPVPSALRNKQSIINIKNSDYQCLRWTLGAALFPTQDTKHSDRPSKHPINDRLDFSGILFPTPLNEISKFETMNNIAINVFGWVDNRVIVRRISPVENPYTQKINLMLINKDNKSHYCYIKRLNRLLYNQHNTGHKVFFCERCLQGFSLQHVLDDHIFYCRSIKYRPATKIEMPREGKNILKFENYQNQMKCLGLSMLT